MQQALYLLYRIEHPKIYLIVLQEILNLHELSLKFNIFYTPNIFILFCCYIFYPKLRIILLSGKNYNLQDFLYHMLQESSSMDKHIGIQANSMSSRGQTWKMSKGLHRQCF